MTPAKTSMALALFLVAAAAHAKDRPEGDEATRPDPAVKLVLGETLEQYEKRGYKEVELGSSFAAVDRRTPLKWVRDPRISPHVFTNAPGGAEDFVFDANRKLVCYTKSYDGGPDDYLEQLSEVFGKTNKEIREFTSERRDSATRRSAVDYTFPRVLVRLVFVKTAFAIADRVRTKEETYVEVLDREWASALLTRDAAAKRKNLAWLKKVAAAVCSGDIREGALPALARSTVKTEKTKEDRVLKVMWLDEATQKRNKGRRPHEQIREVFADVSKENFMVPPRSPFGDRRVVQVNFSFEHYTPNKAGAVLDQPEPAGFLASKGPGANALAFTPFEDLLMELNAVLVQEYFPPRTEKIQLVRPQDGPRYYQWQTEDGWKVICDFNNRLTLEKLEGKGL